MSEISGRDLIDQIAVQVVMLDPGDAAGVAALDALFDALEKFVSDDAAELVEDCRYQLGRLLGSAQVDPATVVESLNSMVSDLQDALGRTPMRGPAELVDAAPVVFEAPIDTSSLARFVMPEHVDDDVFSDFVAAQQHALDDMEGAALALEREDGGDLDAIKRSLHSLKGEAGMLGLDELGSVAHGLEDYIAGAADDAPIGDRVLGVIDWVRQALRVYGEGYIPTPSAVHVIERMSVEGPFSLEENAADALTALLADDAPEADDGWGEPEDPWDAVGPEPDVVAEPAAPVPIARQDPDATALVVDVDADADAIAALEIPTGPVKIEWGEEELELFGEFLLESSEGLDEADQVLLAVESSGTDSEGLNKLFRAFHTIKGVAGFLGLEAVTRLAHKTETLMDRARTGEMAFEGAALDAVFDSTEMMRWHLDATRVAMESRGSVEPVEGLAALLLRIDAIVDGRAVPAARIPVADKGMKLGEVVQAVARAAQEEAVEAALKTQAKGGGRVGSELVRSGAFKPTEVARAARAQKRTRAGVKAGQKQKETVRVDLDRVDSLVEQIGELAIVEAMVANDPEISELSSPNVRNLLGQLTKISRDLQSLGMRMRMVPLRGVFQKTARMVRDLSRQSGKKITITIDGEATEMDRSMVEHIGDPLVHIIRNAVDHGIEPEELRAETGKPAVGQLFLSARHQGGNIVVEVRDDGRGLNRDAIVAKAIEKGVIDDADGMRDEDVFSMIFAPGFSTAQQVTKISGRGVGMDVVKRNIDAMRGRVGITSVAGEGTTIQMVLPLTLAIIDGMLIRCGAERYIIPTLSIIESLQPDESMLGTAAGSNEYIDVRGEIVPLFRLDRLLDVQGASDDPEQSLVVVVETLGQKVGLVIDEVLTQQQVVIKSLGSGLGRTKFISGGAILSDGQVGLILNVEEIGSLSTRRYFRSRGNSAARV